MRMESKQFTIKNNQLNTKKDLLKEMRGKKGKRHTESKLNGKVLLSN